MLGYLRAGGLNKEEALGEVRGHSTWSANLVTRLGPAFCCFPWKTEALSLDFSKSAGPRCRGLWRPRGVEGDDRGDIAWTSGQGGVLQSDQKGDGEDRGSPEGGRGAVQGCQESEEGRGVQGCQE